MPINKMSKINLSLFMALMAIIALCVSAISCFNDRSINSSAAVSSVSVTFADFPDTVTPYCAVTFYNSNGSTVNAVITTSGDSFSLGGATGKLEVTVPMYSSVTSTLPDYIQNGSTYYIDVSSSTSLTSLTITYADLGYFGSTVVI